MGKEARARVLADHQAKAIGRMIRVSPRKLNLVAQTIRGKKAEAALNELTFSPKRIAKTVKKILQSAIANAENNHDLDDLLGIACSRPPAEFPDWRNCGKFPVQLRAGRRRPFCGRRGRIRFGVFR